MVSLEAAGWLRGGQWLSRSDQRKDPRHTAHPRRHTFAAISLSKADADLLAVSRAMGHARPLITLDRYGHLAPAGRAPLMARIDELVGPLAKAA